MCIYMCTCTNMHTAYTWTHIYTAYTCTCTHMHTYIHKHTHVHCIHINAHTFTAYRHTYRFIHILYIDPYTIHRLSVFGNACLLIHHAWPWKLDVLRSASQMGFSHGRRTNPDCHCWRSSRAGLSQGQSLPGNTGVLPGSGVSSCSP